MWETLRRVKLTLDKESGLRPKQLRPDVAAARDEWRALQEKLVFIR
jgi:hypothetical protein